VDKRGLLNSEGQSLVDQKKNLGGSGGRIVWRNIAVEEALDGKYLIPILPNCPAD
jgi:hypothetical protein